MISVNDLFCGAGGMGLGFRQAGFRLSGAWDFDKHAVKSYDRNISPRVKRADITTMTAKDLPYADVWTFGFPCQDISVAGKRAGMTKGETRSGLFYEVMRLLEESSDKPKIILAENVKALKNLLPVLKEEYAKAGYIMYVRLYNSKYWGVPQNRERYFVVGVREDIDKGYFRWPQQDESYVPKLSSVLEDEVDEKYYISDEKAQKIIEQALKRVELKSVHSRITPGRVDKRQNGRRAKDEEEEMYTLTSQDLHGVILDDTYGFDGVRVYENECPTLRSSRQGLKVAQDLHGLIVDDRGFKNKEIKPHEISPTLRAEEHGNTNKVILEESTDRTEKLGGIRKIEVELPVKVRKHTVDTERLKSLLRTHKGIRKLTNKQIAESLNRPSTEVEHWFRTDKCFSIPDPDLWKDLKQLLDITTKEFDASITEFIEKPNEYEMAGRFYDPNGIAPTVTANGKINVIGRLDMKEQDNIRRVYDTEGISPTLTTSEGGHRQPKILTVGNVNPSGNGMNGQVYHTEGLSPTCTTNKGEGHKVTDGFKVRKLTPREYARLQGFPDSFEFVCSNSQMYKQFGNAVTVNVSKAIAERIKEFLA